MSLPLPKTVTVEAESRPYDLGSVDSYRRWRDRKMQAYPQRCEDVQVEIGDFANPTAAEIDALRVALRRANFAVYRLSRADPDGRRVLGGLGAALGLRTLDANPYADEDRISALQVRDDAAAKGYIPYTNRALNWHTDGYYNPPVRRIRAFSMHCAVPASIGGGNSLIDHEMIYIALRDKDPALIAALMRGDAMTVPANVENGVELRAVQCGPVFTVEPGGLHMRYTARTRSIEWADHPDVLTASREITRLLSNDNPQVLSFRLGAGEGLICNNVLHRREAYEDRAPLKRLMYRARYYERA